MQEQPTFNLPAANFTLFGYTGNSEQAVFSFTDIGPCNSSSGLSSGPYYQNGDYFWFTITDCRLRGVGIGVDDVAYNENIFTVGNTNLEQCSLSFTDGSESDYYGTFQVNAQIDFYNNLFWGAWLTLNYYESGSSYDPSWSITDNLFDGSGFSYNGNGNDASDVVPQTTPLTTRPIPWAAAATSL